MKSVRALLRSSALRESVSLLAISTVSRGLSALGAVVVAYAAGAGLQMDLFMACSLVAASYGLMVAVAIPSVASSVIAKGAVHNAKARATVRSWAVRLSNWGTVSYFVLLPLMAWLFSPPEATSFWPLTLLLSIAAGSVWLAPRLTAEQTLLQGLGLGKRAASYAVVSTVVMLLGCLVTAATGSVVWALAGVPVGASAEYWLLRRALKRETHAKVAPNPVDSGHPLPGFPWKAYVIFTCASLSAFVIGLIDQALLARIGDNAQALWGLAGRPASFFAHTLFAVVTVFGTVLAVKSDLNDVTGFRQQTLKLAGAATLAIATLLALLVVGAEPMVRVLYERGEFGPQDTHRTAETLGLTVWTYVLYPASIVLVRAMSTLHAYRPLLLSTAAFLVAKMGLGLLLLPMGLLGVTMSTFAAMSAQLVILYVALQRMKDRAG